MSRAYDARYMLELKRRRELFNARVREKTEPFYRKYSDMYEELMADGEAAYIPDEMQLLKNDLDRMGELLSTDPAQARTISFSISDYIYDLRRQAENARQKAAMELRIQERKAEREILDAAAQSGKHADNRAAMEAYYGEMEKITDFFAMGFMTEELQALQEEIERGTVRAEEIPGRVSAITSKAQAKAAEWQAAQAEKKKQESLSEIESIGENIKQLENADTQQTLRERIEELKKLAEEKRLSHEEVRGRLEEINNDLDDAVISEETRREAVKAVFKQLKSQEFTVEAPQLVTEGGTNYVLIKAHKPSGKRAVCKIDLHGGLCYQFDHYEGMTCLKDIEKFNEELDKVYSIKLSDERVIASNPDKLSSDSVNNPNAKGGGSNG